jgi:hypothetical protein
MPDYSKGKVYIIRAPGTDRVYIGSTVMPLEKRLYQHRRLQGGCRSRELVTIPGHTIEQLEYYPCSTVEELRKREGYFIRQYAGRTINKNIAGRTGREYMAEHADRYRAQALAWYYANKGRRHAYEEKTRECRLAKMKEYYQNVVKPRKEALRSAAGTSTTTSAGGDVLPEAAALNPTSVAAASDAGV